MIHQMESVSSLKRGGRNKYTVGGGFLRINSHSCLIRTQKYVTTRGSIRRQERLIGLTMRLLASPILR